MKETAIARLFRAALAQLCAIVVLTACAGSGQAPETNADDVDVAALKTGNYPTKPQEPLGKAPDAAKGGQVEARRMAENVVIPFQVDPRLTHMDQTMAGVIRDTTVLSKILPDPVAGTALPNFIAGFASSAGDPLQGPTGSMLTNAVIRLAQPADAEAAVTALAAKSGTIKRPLETKDAPSRPVQIAGQPATRGFAITEGDTDRVLAYTAHGPYLLIQNAWSTEGPDAAARLAAGALDRQIPLIDRFQPTPVDQIASIPLDPDGLVARTLDPFPDRNYVYEGQYGPHGILAFSDSPAADEKSLTDAGVSAVVTMGADLYQARDEPAAAALLDRDVAEFTSNSKGNKFAASDGVDGMPRAKCLYGAKGPDRLSPRYICMATAGRYMFRVYAGSKPAAHQRLAAQYLMLTAQ